MKNRIEILRLTLVILVFGFSLNLLTPKSIQKIKTKSTRHLSISSQQKESKIPMITNSRLLYLTFQRRKSTNSQTYSTPVSPTPTTTTTLSVSTPVAPSPPPTQILTVNQATVTQNSNENYVNQVNLNQSGDATALNVASVTQNTNTNFGNQAGVIQEQNQSGGVNLSQIQQSGNDNSLNQATTLQSITGNGVNFSQTVQQDNVGAINVSQTTHEIKDTPLGSLAFNVGLQTNGNAAVAVQSYYTAAYDPAQFWAFAKQFEQQTNPTTTPK